MNLAQLQQAFQQRVLHGSSEIERFVPGSAEFDTATRLRIYEYAYGARLIEALAKTYSALQVAMGEKQFTKLIYEYAMEKPPSHFSIRYYGDDLSSFILRHLPGTKAKVLSELARWEWLLAASFDAADVSPLTKESLATIAPEQWAQLRFTLSPSFHRVTSQTNAVQWWRSLSEGSSIPTRWRVTKSVEWAIWRSDLKTYFRSLQADEACAIDCVLKGQSFATLCERLAEFGHADNAPLRAATLLSQWFNDGWIAGLDLH